VKRRWERRPDPRRTRTARKGVSSPEGGSRLSTPKGNGIRRSRCAEARPQQWPWRGELHRLWRTGKRSGPAPSEGLARHRQCWPLPPRPCASIRRQMQSNRQEHGTCELKSSATPLWPASSRANSNSSDLNDLGQTPMPRLRRRSAKPRASAHHQSQPGVDARTLPARWRPSVQTWRLYAFVLHSTTGTKVPAAKPCNGQNSRR
jgi:hypothetical protein